MSRIDWSLLYWGIWIVFLFLIPELLGFFHIAPWETLSETAWWSEKHFPIMKTVFFGFLIGLCIHIVFRTPLGRTQAVSLFVSLLIHLAWGVV